MDRGFRFRCSLRCRKTEQTACLRGTRGIKPSAVVLDCKIICAFSGVRNIVRGVFNCRCDKGRVSVPLMQSRRLTLTTKCRVEPGSNLRSPNFKRCTAFYDACSIFSSNRPMTFEGCSLVGYTSVSRFYVIFCMGLEKMASVVHCS